MDYIPVVNTSLLNLNDNEDYDSFERSFSDFSLKSGVVVKSYDISDKDNVSKTDVEFDVLTVSQNKDLGTASVIYRHCQLMQSFGSIADYSEHTIRLPKKNVKLSTAPQDDTGAVVLLLCLNGNQSKGIIIGALRHAQRKSNISKSKDISYESEFNGLNYKIGTDGSLTITFKSATDEKGKPKDSKAGGSYLKINKTGQIELNSGNDDYLTIDKTNKDVKAKAGRHIDINATKNVDISAGQDLNVKTTKDLIAQAQGNATLKASSQFKIQSDSLLEIKSSSSKIDAGSVFTLKASQIFVKGSLIMLGSGGTPAIVFSTQFLGIGNLGAPVVSQAIGPFSSSVFIAS